MSPARCSRCGADLRGGRPSGEGVAAEVCSRCAADLVPSPCIGTCELDLAQVCIGCRRTMAEIAAWSGLSAAAKRAVLSRIDARDA